MDVTNPLLGNVREPFDAADARRISSSEGW
jgi:hypothetical protein